MAMLIMSCKQASGLKLRKHNYLKMEVVAARLSIAKLQPDVFANVFKKG